MSAGGHRVTARSNTLRYVRHPTRYRTAIPDTVDAFSGGANSTNTSTVASSLLRIRYPAKLCSTGILQEAGSGRLYAATEAKPNMATRLSSQM